MKKHSTCSASAGAGKRNHVCLPLVGNKVRITRIRWKAGLIAAYVGRESEKFTFVFVRNACFSCRLRATQFHPLSLSLSRPQRNMISISIALGASRVCFIFHKGQKCFHLFIFFFIYSEPNVKCQKSNWDGVCERGICIAARKMWNAEKIKLFATPFWPQAMLLM